MDFALTTLNNHKLNHRNFLHHKHKREAHVLMQMKSAVDMKEIEMMERKSRGIAEQ